MNKIVDYKIVLSRNPADIVSQVKELLLEEFQPLGELISVDGFYHQVLVKYEEIYQGVTNLELLQRLNIGDRNLWTEIYD